MTTIGNFKKQDGEFHGTLETLTINRAITIRPVEQKANQGPDFRVYAGAAEIGAAWAKTSEAKKAYLSVKLDDPTFAAPIACRLIGREDGSHLLLWNR